MNRKLTFSTQTWAKLCLAGGVFLCATAADAQKYFDSASSGTTWQQGVLTNWGTVSGGPYNTAQWAAYNDGVMEGTGAAINVSGGINVNNLSFTADGYSLSGGGVTFGSPGGGPYIDVGTGLTATISNTLSRAGGGASIRKLGEGTLILNGTTTMTAGGTYGLTVERGTIEIPSGSLNMTNGGNVWVGNTAAATGTLTVNGGTLTLGNKELLVSQNSTGHGVFNVSNGTVTTGGSGVTYLGNFGTSAANFSGGAFTSTRGMIITVRGNSTLTVSGTADVQLTSLQFFHSAGVTGTGKSATVSLNGGTLSVTGISDAVASGNTSTFNFNGGTLKAGAANGSFMTGLDTATVQSGGAFIDTNTFDITIGQALLAGAPSGGLTKNGAGTLTLTGANTYSAGTTVNNGTLNATVNTTQNAIGTGSATITAGTTLIMNNTNTSGSTVTIGNTFNNVGGGAGTLQLNFAANTTARNTTMNNVTSFNGLIRLSNSGATGDKWNVNGVNAANADLQIDSGSQLFIASGTNTFKSISVAGTGNSEGRGAIRLIGTLSGPISLAADASIGPEGGTIGGAITSGAAGTQTLTMGAPNSGSTANYNGVIGGGTGTIAVAVTNGTNNLGAAVVNTYSGGTTLTGGVLVANNNGSLGGGTITLNGGTLRSGSGNRTFTNAVVANTSTTSTLDSPTNNNLTLNGNITGSGNINKIGGWSVFLGGDNSGFGGTYTTSESNSFFNSANAGSAAANWVINVGNLANTLTGDRTLHLGSLSGSGGQLGNNVGSSNITYSIGALDSNSTYAGNIVNSLGGGGSIAIAKVGIGTLTLTGTNSYTGSTTVNAGTLLINGTHNGGGLYAVGDGTGVDTLGGNGTINAAVTIATGSGVLAPGTSPGILNINGNVSIAGALEAELAGLTAGTNYDQLRLGTTAGTFGVTLSGTLDAVFSDTGWAAPNSKLWIINNQSGGSLTGTFSNYPTNGQFVTNYDGLNWYIHYGADFATQALTGGNDVVLMAVPEPASAVLLALGAAALWRLRRRRK